MITAMERPTLDLNHDAAAVPTHSASAVSWGAILAGAAGAAAMSLILLILGTGLGLSSVSPWAHSGVSAKALGVSTILWVTFTALIASGLGGYLAGRLRTRWLGVHSDEVHFRDTAHGFLAWAVASLATAALLTSVIGSIVSGGIQAGASVAGSVANTATAAAAGNAAHGSDSSNADSGPGPMGYFIDTLFRKDYSAETSSLEVVADAAASAAIAEPSHTASPSEVTRIFVKSLSTGTLPADDVRYLGQVIAKRTGISQQDAERRVSDTFARVRTELSDAEASAKEAADKARKASAYTALWLFISLLIGAFVASLSATFGGRQRDA